jgi:signal transduction histidine kinase
MKEFWDYLLLLLGQFAGGPGPKENNLVRFGLAAVLWAILLAVAWSRQRNQALPRERLLVWGFGLGLARELYMFFHVSLQLIQGQESEGLGLHISEPLEHALTMAAIVTVAGAFIRYILDDAHRSRRYLQVGLTVTTLSFGVIWLWWYNYATQNPGSRFNQTWGGVVFFLLTGLFAAIALVHLSRRRGWLRNAISLALASFILIGVLRLVNFSTGRGSADILCRVCNSLHILAIPVFGYVYIREQAIEKEEAEQALAAYRDHLEDLVAARTGALTLTNRQLQAEIAERQQAEENIVRRNAELAAQNAIAATLSRSLDLDRILETSLDTVLAVLDMDAGCVCLLEPESDTLQLRTSRGPRTSRETRAPAAVFNIATELCSCLDVSRRSVEAMEPVVLTAHGFDCAMLAAVLKTSDAWTLVSTPLVAKDRAVGALSLCSSRPDAVPAHELEILAAIGQQIGMAVENARLYLETGQWAEELALLHESSIFLTGTLDADTIYQRLCEQCVKLLGCHAAAILLWDEESRQAIPILSYSLNGDLAALRLDPKDSQLLAALLETRGSIPIEDGENDPLIPPSWRRILGARALLAVPLWGKDRPLAFLILIDERASRSWRPSEVVWVESFANPAAIALENAYLYSQVERAAALEERQRIAAEMHDGLAQTLSYVMLKASNASDLLEAGEIQDVHSEYRDIHEALVRATTEVRQSIASLQQSPQPPHPLQELLSDVVRDLSSEGDGVVQFESSVMEPLLLPLGQVEQIVRIVQEAVLNACRHAAAAHIRVHLEGKNNLFLVTVDDDGRGLDPAVVPGGEHFGLQIMQARAARMGGHLEIDSAPGRGTRVVLEWAASEARHPLSPVDLAAGQPSLTKARK